MINVLRERVIGERRDIITVFTGYEGMDVKGCAKGGMWVARWGKTFDTDVLAD